MYVQIASLVLVTASSQILAQLMQPGRPGNSQGLYLVFLFSRFGIACFNELIAGRTIAASVIIPEIVAGLMIRFIDLNAKPIRSPLIIWLRIIAVIAAFNNRSIAIVCEFGSLSLSFFCSPVHYPINLSLYYDIYMDRFILKWESWIQYPQTAI